MNKRTKKERGITLIALVITIIVLLILAGVSIAMLTGDNGILTKATEAKRETEIAEEEEKVRLAIASAIDDNGNFNKSAFETELGNQGLTYTTDASENILVETDNKKYTIDSEGKITKEENKASSGGTTPVTPVEPKKTTVLEAKEDPNKLSTTENTELVDAYGNKIVIPAGFTLKVDDTTSNATTVDKGIVVEDRENNEFVWIPVGKIYTDINKINENAKEIELKRCDFNEEGESTELSSVWVEEDSTATDKLLNYGNKIAKDINAFKTSVQENGGYYIGRYEARTEIERNNSSKDQLTKVTEKRENYIYNFTTQPQLAEQCQKMYNSTKPFNSDLINSYAWDTAIIFIQKCGSNSKYSNQTSLETSYSSTGTTTDIQCNIYDMASNVREWTTETLCSTEAPCALRGGYSGGTSTVDRRASTWHGTNDNPGYGGRVIIYI